MNPNNSQPTENSQPENSQPSFEPVNATQPISSPVQPESMPPTVPVQPTSYVSDPIVPPQVQMPPIAQSVEPLPPTQMPPSSPPIAIEPEKKKVSAMSIILILAALVLIASLAYIGFVKMTTKGVATSTPVSIMVEPTEAPIETEAPVVVEEVLPTTIPATDSAGIVPSTTATPSATP